MNSIEFEALNKKFSPLIKKIIDDNQKFYQLDETIRWCFGYDENEAIMATCNRETNIISVNIKSVERAFSTGNFKPIEYFLIHEIRHVFQHIVIKKYNNNINTGVDPEIIKKWIYETKNYVKSNDEHGNLNPDYFLQDLEIDAYAFAYAVMKYKYEDVEDLYVPEIYGNEFNDIVNYWLRLFKEEQL